MDLVDGIYLICIIVLVALSAFFSASETALVSCNRFRIRSMFEQDKKNKRAAYLNKVLDRQDKMLAAILIGNNVVNLSASALTTTLAIRIGTSYAVGVGTGILTLVILIFSEVSPKTAATVKAESFALFVAPVIYYLMFILTPVIFIINIISRGFLRIFRINPSAKKTVITEEELHTIVDVSHEEGVIEQDEMNIINNVMDFDDSVVKDIMTPRIDMMCVNMDATYDELLKVYRESMFTRLPVYKETMDNVVGLVNVKDLLFYDRSREFHVANFLREPYYTYEYKNISELFLEMRQQSVSIAVVLDEYGTTEGVVTLEDLLEELVGEIRDEYDSDELKSVEKIAENEYQVEGVIKINDLNDWLGLDLNSDNFDSIGGYVIGLLGELPEEGQTVEKDGFTFRVESVEKNRIQLIHMWTPKPESDEEES